MVLISRKCTDEALKDGNNNHENVIFFHTFGKKQKYSLPHWLEEKRNEKITTNFLNVADDMMDRHGNSNHVVIYLKNLPKPGKSFGYEWRETFDNHEFYTFRIRIERVIGKEDDDRMMESNSENESTLDLFYNNSRGMKTSLPFRENKFLYPDMLDYIPNDNLIIFFVKSPQWLKYHIISQFYWIFTIKEDFSTLLVRGQVFKNISKVAI